MELAEQEDLDEDEKVYLSGKASHIEIVFSNPERIAAVCTHIVEHYLKYVAPHGQKAQVIAYGPANITYSRISYRRRPSACPRAAPAHTPPSWSCPDQMQRPRSARPGVHAG